MQVPRKAFILAAGFGTRLRPLTAHVPKPLLHVWGRPILDHTLDMLANWGVEEVLINGHHAREAINAYVTERNGKPLRLHFSPEETILGTGGALAHGRWFAETGPFWMVNGDILADLSPAPFVDTFDRAKATGVLWMHPSLGPRTVKLAGNRILNFRTPNPGEPGTFTFCGLQLLSPDILRFIPPNGFSTIVEAYERAMLEGHDILGLSVTHSYWADAGTPEAFIAAHRDTLTARNTHKPGGRFVSSQAVARAEKWQREGVEVHGFLAAGRGCRIAPTAQLHDVVLMDNVAVAAEASVHECVAGPGAPLQGEVHGIAVPVSDTSPALMSATRGLGWEPADVLCMPFPPRGSARTFARLRHAGEEVIAIEYELERPENARFVPNARFLASTGVRVPEILFDDSQTRTTLVEDLGDVALLDLVKSGPAASVPALYEQVLPLVVRLHTEATAAAKQRNLDLCKPFSPTLYTWEHDLFLTHFVEGHLGRDPTDLSAATEELRSLGASLDTCSTVLVHRDLQSSNIIFMDGEPALIDFQGMRYGPDAYDLASLLCDPYVSLPLAVQEPLIARYAAMRGIEADRFAEHFWRAAVQRMVQALGAYGRLGALRGMQNFTDHIPPALRMVKRALRHLPNMPNLWHFFCCVSEAKGLP